MLCRLESQHVALVARVSVRQLSVRKYFFFHILTLAVQLWKDRLTSLRFWFVNFKDACMSFLQGLLANDHPRWFIMTGLPYPKPKAESKLVGHPLSGEGLQGLSIFSSTRHFLVWTAWVYCLPPSPWGLLCFSSSHCGSSVLHDPACSYLQVGVHV